MKHKVFLVEDEFMMRQAIRDSVKWQDNGFIFAGEASDGEVALPIIEKVLPDIIVTDIKMPFMDGITLAKKVKESFPQIKIIILSGYDEFSYAKEALTIGVEEYLLKPIDSAELISVLKKVASQIDKENEERNRLKRFQEMFEHNNNVKEDIEPYIKSFMKVEENTVLPQFNSAYIEAFLRHGNKADTEEVVDEYTKGINPEANWSLLFTYYVFIDVVMSVRRFIESLGGQFDVDVIQISDVYKIASNITSVAQLKENVGFLLNKSILFRNSKSDSKYGVYISEAKEYITENYHDPELSLSKVATNVNMSPNHFSTVFAQECNITFIEFLTKLRIEKAKDLLKSTNLRISDVAYQIGYNDPHYFSNLFKKEIGISPRDFKINK